VTRYCRWKAADIQEMLPRLCRKVQLSESSDESGGNGDSGSPGEVTLEVFAQTLNVSTSSDSLRELFEYYRLVIAD